MQLLPCRRAIGIPPWPIPFIAVVCSKVLQSAPKCNALEGHVMSCYVMLWLFQREIPFHVMSCHDIFMSCGLTEGNALEWWCLWIKPLWVHRWSTFRRRLVPCVRNVLRVRNVRNVLCVWNVRFVRHVRNVRNIRRVCPVCPAIPCVRKVIWILRVDP